MNLTELRIRNFRGIKKLDLQLDSSTVLIGENNTGKSTVLAAVRYALEQGRNRRTAAFDEFDYHLTTQANDPHAAPPISIELIFKESPENEWSDELVQALGDIISIGDDDKRKVWLRTTSQWNSTLSDFESKIEFLDKDGNPLQGKGANPANVSRLQRLRPVFYLSALRDAGKEFSKQSQFWGSFLKGTAVTPELKAEIESELSELNTKVIQAHKPFEDVKSELARVQELIPTSNLSDVSVDAIPGRLFDMLSRTQVSISSSSGAKVPIVRHGEGTQSLSVLLLFDAFLKSRLTQAFERATTPILAIEEPEAHLHPCAIRTLWKTIDSLPGQKLISSHSGDLLAEAPVGSVRRLFRRATDIHVGYVKSGTLNAQEQRMFNHHVRRSRGELLFANCWLLCEGESDALLLRRCSDLIGADFSRWGVRLIEYRGADIGLFIKVANDLGIEWHVFADNDPQGKVDQRKVRENLGEKTEAERLTFVPEEGWDLEQHLATNGFLQIYESQLSPQLSARLTTRTGDAGYSAEVAKLVAKGQKPELMEKVASEIEKRGTGAVPTIISSSIRRAVTLAGGALP